MSNFDETLMKRLTKLEREVERLQVKERPDSTAFLQTPSWTSWTPTVTGWAAGYTVIARYCKVGKLCMAYLYISGTSNTTSARATLPLSASGEPGFSYFQVPMYRNNSIYNYVGGQCIAQVIPGGQAAWFLLDGSLTGWTASGDKTVAISLFYEVE